MHPTAVVYTRISEKNDQKDKVADQETDCRALAAKYGYTVTEVFVDNGITAMRGKDGKTKVRPGFDALLDAITRGEVGVVLATEESRFDRDGQAKRELEIACAEAGTVWHTVRDGQVDPSTDAGEMMSQFRVLMDRQEIRRKTVRQRDDNDKEIAKGRPLKGKRRFGYEPDGMTPRESEAESVRWAYTEVLAGRSLYSVQRAFNDAGITGAYGHTWDGPKVRKLLLNPHNKGVLIHRGEPAPYSRITPLVDANTWKEVEAILLDPARLVTPGPKVRTGVLSGIAVCGVCQAPLQSAANTQRGKAVLLYKCSLKAQGHGQGETHPSIRRHALESAVAVAEFNWIVANGDTMKEADTPRLGALSLALAEANRKRAAQQMLIEAEGVDVTAVLSRIAELGGEATRLRAEIEAERAASIGAGVIEKVRGDWYEMNPVDDIAAYGVAILQQAETWHEYWAGLEIETRRDFIQSTLHITLNRGTDIDRIDIRPVSA